MYRNVQNQNNPSTQGPTHLRFPVSSFRFLQNRFSPLSYKYTLTLSQLSIQQNSLTIPLKSTQHTYTYRNTHSNYTMAYLNRVWAAATVAVVNGHSDHGGQTLKSGLRSIQHGRRRFSSSSSSGAEHADVRPISSIAGGDHAGAVMNCNGDDVRKQADESLRQVMYLSCWGPS